jgi:superfamily II DNA/RNA helicase
VGRTARAGEKGVAITLMSGGEIGDVAAVEQLLGSRIPRVNVPGYSFFVAETPLVLGEDGEPVEQAPVEEAPMPKTQRAAQKEARTTRGRKTGELSQEELAKLLRVG